MKKHRILAAILLLSFLVLAWPTNPAIHAVAQGDKALLIQIDAPWGSNSNQTILAKLVSDGQFKSFDQKSATEVSAPSFDLSVYKLVLFANDQSQVSYDQYGSVLKDKLEAFAHAGGVVVFGVCDQGWNNGTLSALLPGDIEKIEDYEINNIIASPDNPIVTGELSNREPLTNADLYGEFCSHVSFVEDSLPTGSVVIFRGAGNNNPTLVDYPYGTGHIIASGLTWEYSYANNLPFALKAYPDLMIYALNVALGVYEGNSVTYNANGATSGLVPVDAKTYQEGSSVTVLGNTGSLARTRYTFAGWNTLADGSGQTYQSGAAFAMGANAITLFAKWTPNVNTISFPELSGKTYGDADFSAGATASSGLLVSYSSSDSDVAVVIDNKVHIVGTGNVTITASQAGNADYPPATAQQQSFTVARRDLSLSGFAVNTKTYDGNTTASVTFSDNRISGDSLTFSYTAAYDNEVAGTGKPVSVSNIAISGGSSSTYYNLMTTSATASGDISRRLLTLTDAAAESKTYDGSRSAVITGGTLSGICLDDAVNLSSSGLFDTSDAGTGKTVTPALSGDDSGNYAITLAQPLKSDILPAPLIVTANDRNRAYGSVNPAFTAGYSGFVAGDTPTSLGGTLTFTTPASASSPVDTYAIKPAGLTSGNYTITFVPGTLTVDQAELTVTADDKSRAYGSDNPELTASFSGFALSETAANLGGTLALTTPAVAGSPADSYSITPAGLTSGNYLITFVPGTLTVKPLAITVTALAQDKLLGTADPQLTYSVTPELVAGDAFQGALIRVSGESAGQYAIGQGTLTAGTNYSIQYAAANLTIEPSTAVSFEARGGSAIPSQIMASHGKVTEPTAPERAGYDFIGWYTDADLTTAWNFADATDGRSTMTLYARWLSVNAISQDPATGVASDDPLAHVALPELQDPQIEMVLLKLNVELKTPAESASQPNFAIATGELAQSNLELLQWFDISLLKTLTKVDGSSSVSKVSALASPMTIRLPIPAGYASRTGLKVAYIDDAGKVTYLESQRVTVNGAAYLEFQTDHFSVYSMVATRASSVPVTGESSQGALIGLLLLLGAIGLGILQFIIRHRRRA